MFSTLDAGPIMIVTTPAGMASNPDRVRALEAAGAGLEPIEDGALRTAFARLARIEVTSLLLEGGARLHLAAWEAGLVDAVHLYIAPVTLGSDGVPWLDAQTFSTCELTDRQIRAYGPDIFLEGYVHRTH
jgi:diaminohydroxyphosphoribosylaminopyrimidine deaminase/5-amino-6-(5-phosphoribosylamino)uracil reductase